MVRGETELERGIAALDRATTTPELIAAVQSLGATQDPAALPPLIRAFGFNRPAVAEAALAEVLRFGAAAVDPLLSLVDGYDYGARAYSVRALARLGDPRALTFFLEALRSDFAPSVRRAAVRGLGRLALADPAQVLAALGTALVDADWGIRYAAVCALADLPADLALSSQRSALIAVAAQDADPLIRFKTQASFGVTPTPL